MESWVSTIATGVGCFTMSYPNNPNYAGDPHGIQHNPCYPARLAPYAEYGFALMPNDPYYAREGIYGYPDYSSDTIPADILSKAKPPSKRSFIFDLEQERILADDGNSTSLPTQDELEALKEWPELKEAFDTSLEEYRRVLELGESVQVVASTPATATETAVPKNTAMARPVSAPTLNSFRTVSRTARTEPIATGLSST